MMMGTGRVQVSIGSLVTRLLGMDRNPDRWTVVGTQWLGLTQRGARRSNAGCLWGRNRRRRVAAVGDGMRNGGGVNMWMSKLIVATTVGVGVDQILGRSNGRRTDSGSTSCSSSSIIHGSARKRMRGGTTARDGAGGVMKSLALDGIQGTVVDRGAATHGRAGNLVGRLMWVDNIGGSHRGCNGGWVGGGGSTIKSVVCVGDGGVFEPAGHVEFVALSLHDVSKKSRAREKVSGKEAIVGLCCSGGIRIKGWVV
ncbi:MAG: hypothetical protein J3R72DRAFT_436684 [Linnemannia gamsii]|nr:MAG: hypothetical protein J3R72DRAFT_436684 [Linnemannia gamsii]